MAAEQWVPVEAHSTNRVFAVDTLSIRRDGAIVTFRERLVFTKPEQRDAVSGKLIKEKQVLRAMRCSEKTQGVKAGSLFDESGRLIESVSLDDKLIAWAPIPQGTVAEREMDLVCNPTAAAKPADTPP
ncbi:MAG TPA: surface-adhesin E family protein [Burkholderiales bacterium]|nr:surface-adhesin E family protein [Burkholderiales bacterium]